MPRAKGYLQDTRSEGRARRGNRRNVACPGPNSIQWMNRVFRMLYSDKRNNGWKRYGPGVLVRDRGAKWGCLVETDDKGKHKVRSNTLYAAFIGEDTAPVQIHIPTVMRATDRQATWTR